MNLLFRVTKIFAFLVLCLSTLSQNSFANHYDRPFWTEKSAYVDGDVFFAVGVASNAHSIETGRQIAFQNGVQEILNYAQIRDAHTLSIETQMTYEEKTSEKTFNVFRLLKTDRKNLLAAKKRQKILTHKPLLTHINTSVSAIGSHNKPKTVVESTIKSRIKDKAAENTFWLGK